MPEFTGPEHPVATYIPFPSSGISEAGNNDCYCGVTTGSRIGFT